MNVLCMYAPLKLIGYTRKLEAGTENDVFVGGKGLMLHKPLVNYSKSFALGLNSHFTHLFVSCLMHILWIPNYLYVYETRIISICASRNISCIVW